MLTNGWFSCPEPPCTRKIWLICKLGSVRTTKRKQTLGMTEAQANCLQASPASSTPRLAATFPQLLLSLAPSVSPLQHCLSGQNGLLVTPNLSPSSLEPVAQTGSEL